MKSSLIIYVLLIFASCSVFALPQPDRKQKAEITKDERNNIFVRRGLADNILGENSTITSDIHKSVSSNLRNSKFTNINDGIIENRAKSGSNINSGILVRGATVHNSEIENRTSGSGRNTASGGSDVNYGIRADKANIRNSSIKNIITGNVTNNASGGSYINSGIDMSEYIGAEKEEKVQKTAGIKNILAEEGSLELSFIDSSYDNDNYSLAEAGENKKVFVLEPGQGLDTITGIVHRYENIGSIKLYTLGNSKRLIIGDDVIKVIGTGSEETNYDFLSSWSPHLAKRTVVSIYSDYIAKNESGKEFLNKLDEEFNKNTASYVTVMGSTNRLGDGDGENYVLNYWSRAIEPSAENIALAKGEANKIDESII